MSTILIISNSGDVHCDYLVDACNRLGVGCFRFNTDKFRRAGHLFWNVIEDNGFLDIDGRRCFLSEVELLIYRRPTPVHRFRTDVDVWVGLLLDKEWDAVENALSSAVSCNIVNPIPGMSIARNKLFQLRIAKSVGLNVPASLVSTQRCELESFVRAHNCVTKGIESAYSIVDGVMRSGMTRRINLQDLDGYKSNEFPTFLQRCVPTPHSFL